MKYYLIAGERSGDMHAANLMRGLAQQDPQATFRYYGGDAMRAVGGELVRHYQDMNFMGIWEVIKNLGKIKRFLRECQADLLAFQPDVLILVDYAGFNMRMAKFAKQNGLRTFYYISPKIWAWNTGRAQNIKRWVDKMFVIFPFEVDFYKQFHYQVDYVGNPLWDAIQQHHPLPDFKAKHQLDERPIVALLPGSRPQEVQKMLPMMLSVRAQFPQHQFVVAGVSNLSTQMYEIVQNTPDVKMILEETYDLLLHSEVAVVTSGTATLETALFNVPQVVGYRTSFLTYKLGRALIKVSYLSLVNLVMDKPVVKELIQSECNPQQLAEELRHIMTGGAKRAAVLADYAALRAKMGSAGASEKAAQLMWHYLQ